jgi:transcription elongation factor SPT6
MAVHIVVPKIIHVLEFLRKERLEIPFIYSYRKDHYGPELQIADLWDIYDWDEKWAHLQSRKAALRQVVLSI